MVQIAYPSSDITVDSGWGYSRLKLVGAGSTAAASITIPTHAVGDLIVIFAYRQSNATAPSLGSGFTSIQAPTNSTGSSRIGYRIATATNTTSGTWTNATHIGVAVFRPLGGTPSIGASTAIASSSTGLYQYDALTLNATDKTSTTMKTLGLVGATAPPSAPANPETFLQATLLGNILGMWFDPAAVASPTSEVPSLSGVTGYTTTVVELAWSGTDTVFAALNDVAADDNSYARCSTSTAVLEVKLGALTDPALSTGHVIHTKLWSKGSGGAESMAIALYQGTTQIVSSSANMTRNTPTLRDVTLTGAQADSITDYSDLRIRFTPTFGSGEGAFVSWANLEVPDAPAAPSLVPTRDPWPWLQAVSRAANW